MAYVKCEVCKEIIHVKPVDEIEFHDKFIKGNELIYCLDCFIELNKNT